MMFAVHRLSVQTRKTHTHTHPLRQHLACVYTIWLIKSNFCNLTSCSVQTNVFMDRPEIGRPTFFFKLSTKLLDPSPCRCRESYRIMSQAERSSSTQSPTVPGPERDQTFSCFSHDIAQSVQFR